MRFPLGNKCVVYVLSGIADKGVGVWRKRRFGLRISHNHAGMVDVRTAIPFSVHIALRSSESANVDQLVTLMMSMNICWASSKPAEPASKPVAISKKP